VPQELLVVKDLRVPQEQQEQMEQLEQLVLLVLQVLALQAQQAQQEQTDLQEQLVLQDPLDHKVLVLPLLVVLQL
jgi:hypothetical protein